MQLLVTEVADHRYALPLDAVGEVVRAVAITRLSGAPAVIEGIVDVRGSIVPVLDLRARFRLPRRAVAPSDHLVVARAGDRVLALRIDRPLGLVEVDPSAVAHPGEGVPGSEYVAGVARLTDGLAVIFDLEAFLSAAEAEALAAALSAAEAAAGEAG